MTFRSRSCVIGRGVVTFSICSAMALASKTPTQIGSTRCPSLSRRMMIGMLVIGSTISPLIVISICMASASDPSGSSRSPACNVGRPDGVKHGSPAGCSDSRRVIRTGTIRPTQSARPGKIHDRVARSCGPTAPSRAAGSRASTRTLDVGRPPRSNSSPWISLLQRLQRHDPPRLLLLRAHRPASASSASVFGRGEYLNENMLW